MEGIHFGNVTQLYLEQGGASTANYIFHCDHFLTEKVKTTFGFQNIFAAVLGVALKQKKPSSSVLNISLWLEKKTSDLLVLAVSLLAEVLKSCNGPPWI